MIKQDQGVNVAGEIVAYCKGKNVTKLSFVAVSESLLLIQAENNV